jgi:hypothetical protein
MRLPILGLCLTATWSLRHHPPEADTRNAERGWDLPREQPRPDYRRLREREGHSVAALIADLDLKVEDVRFIQGCRGDIVALYVDLGEREMVVWFSTSEPLSFTEAKVGWPRWCRVAVIVEVVFKPPYPLFGGDACQSQPP